MRDRARNPGPLHAVAAAVRHQRRRASASTSTTLRSPKPVPRRRRMSKTGAVDRPSEDRPPRTTLIPPPRASAAADPAATLALDSQLDPFFIPDFCATRMVFAVVLIAEIVAVTLALARPDAPFLTELARHLDVPAMARADECGTALLLAALARSAHGAAELRGRVHADTAEHRRDLRARALARHGIRHGRNHGQSHASTGRSCCATPASR